MSLIHVYKFLEFSELQNNYEKSRTEATQTVLASDSLRSSDSGNFLSSLDAESAFNEN